MLLHRGSVPHALSPCDIETGEHGTYSRRQGQQSSERERLMQTSLTPDAHHDSDEDENQDLPESPVIVVGDLKQDNLPRSKGVEVFECRGGDLSKRVRGLSRRRRWSNDKKG